MASSAEAAAPPASEVPATPAVTENAAAQPESSYYDAAVLAASTALRCEMLRQSAFRTTAQPLFSTAAGQTSRSLAAALLKVISTLGKF